MDGVRKILFFLVICGLVLSNANPAWSSLEWVNHWLEFEEDSSGPDLDDAHDHAGDLLLPGDETNGCTGSAYAKIQEDLQGKKCYSLPPLVPPPKFA